MPLYHRELGFPSHMRFREVVGLTPSTHARRAASDDRYGSFEIPTSFDPVTWTVIEIEVINGALVKIVARKALDSTRDLVMAFLIREKLIKTVWVNLASDTHKTLDKSLYSTP